MTPGEFIAKWRASELKERSASQEHFIEGINRYGLTILIYSHSCL